MTKFSREDKIELDGHGSPCIKRRKKEKKKKTRRPKKIWC